MWPTYIIRGYIVYSVQYRGISYNNKATPKNAVK